ncbi:MAG: PCRF domain-containing protein, partial [Thermoanaerobaculia bacterium]|nr:PCRF domain-containing protein [Thermoanaerobaculia bacterium]
MLERLAELERTHEELTARLGDPAFVADRKAFTDASKTLSEISRPIELYRELKAALRQRDENDELLADLPRTDDLYELAHEERTALAAKIAQLEAVLREELLPRDPNDSRNVVLEIRAGTGGDEASLFAGELFRMYSRYAERRHWRVEVIDLSESGVGGIKEISAIVEGRGAYSRLKFEAGVHRVQRVPETEA